MRVASMDWNSFHSSPLSSHPIFIPFFPSLLSTALFSSSLNNLRSSNSIYKSDTHLENFMRFLRFIGVFFPKFYIRGKIAGRDRMVWQQTCAHAELSFVWLSCLEWDRVSQRQNKAKSCHANFSIFFYHSNSAVSWNFPLSSFHEGLWFRE